MEEGTLRKKCCVCSEKQKKLIAYRVNIVLEHDSKNPWICGACSDANLRKKKVRSSVSRAPRNNHTTFLKTDCRFVYNTSNYPGRALFQFIVPSVCVIFFNFFVCSDLWMLEGAGR